MRHPERCGDFGGLAEAIGDHVQKGQALFADDTPVKLLAPGSGKTKTARLWAYVRDERPWAGEAHPAAWYQFSPDRKGIRPQDHLSTYEGFMHADGYARFNDLSYEVKEPGKGTGIGTDPEGNKVEITWGG